MEIDAHEEDRSWAEAAVSKVLTHEMVKARSLFFKATDPSICPSIDLCLSANIEPTQSVEEKLTESGYGESNRLSLEPPPEISEQSDILNSSSSLFLSPLSHSCTIRLSSTLSHLREYTSRITLSPAAPIRAEPPGLENDRTRRHSDSRHVGTSS